MLRQCAWIAVGMRRRRAGCGVFGVGGAARWRVGAARWSDAVGWGGASDLGPVENSDFFSNEPISFPQYCTPHLTFVTSQPVVYGLM